MICIINLALWICLKFNIKVAKKTHSRFKPRFKPCQPAGGGSGTGGVAAVDCSSTSSPSLPPSCAGLPELGKPGELGNLFGKYGKWWWRINQLFPAILGGEGFFPVLSIFFFGNWGVRFNHPSINYQLVHWWFGILGVVLSNNPFHKGFLNMQTTNPNQKLTIKSWNYGRNIFALLQQNTGTFIYSSWVLGLVIEEGCKYHKQQGWRFGFRKIYGKIL